MPTQLTHRRRFFIWLAGLVYSATLPGTGAISAWARSQLRILQADTDLDTLLYEDPAELDPSKIKVSSIDHFGVSGTDDHIVDLETWRLQIGGMVSKPLQLSYTELMSQKELERKLLLICPGMFAYVARWQGFSLWDLLQNGILPGANHVDVFGPPQKYQKIERFSLNEVKNNSVFLATRVNDQVLPMQHGFPLRLAAHGHVGAKWVKYVYRIEAVQAATTGENKTSSGGPAFLP